ncbi:hypothetical protein GW17_00010035 [Ensete ventricosum]|nr:hypothetical protein GW17_00010035 [Ensete ventricosum]
MHVCVCGYGVADRYRTGVGCDGDDDEHESEGDDELEEEGLSCAQCGDSHPAGVEGVEDGLEGEGRGGRAQHLGQYVSGDMRPREMAGRGKRDGDGRFRWAPEMWPMEMMTTQTASPAEVAAPRRVAAPSYFWFTIGVAAALKMRMKVPTNSAITCNTSEERGCTQTFLTRGRPGFANVGKQQDAGEADRNRLEPGGGGYLDSRSSRGDWDMGATGALRDMLAGVLQLHS